MVKVPSTPGTFLRSFRWGHVRQLDRVGRELLSRAWAAGPGDTPLTIDLDSTIRRWMLASDWLIMSVHCERRARSRLGKMPTTSVRRRISRFSRSCGLLDHSFC